MLVAKLALHLSLVAAAASTVKVAHLAQVHLIFVRPYSQTLRNDLSVTARELPDWLAIDGATLTPGRVAPDAADILEGGPTRITCNAAGCAKHALVPTTSSLEGPVFLFPALLDFVRALRGGQRRASSSRLRVPRW